MSKYKFYYRITCNLHTKYEKILDICKNFSKKNLVNEKRENRLFELCLKDYRDMIRSLHYEYIGVR